MQRWQADQFGDIETVLQLQEVDKPGPPPAGCLLLRVLATGVGLPDVLMTKGKYPLVKQPPVTPGQEVVGIVEAVGEGLDFQIGERVMTFSLFAAASGGFAAYCWGQGRFACRVPAAMPDEHAAGMLIPYLTAHTGLVQRCHLQADETLLVLGGTGSSGSAAIQLGKAMGAEVIAVAGGPEKCDFCKTLGADIALDYRQGPIAKQLLNLGKKTDVMYDPVGGELAEDAMKSLAPHGRLGLVGFSSGRWPNLEPAKMVGFSWSAVGVFLMRCTDAEIADAWQDLLAHYCAGKLQPPVAKTRDFSEVPEALADQANGRALGKQVIRIAEQG